jgi:hypothetical protein
MQLVESKYRQFPYAITSPKMDHEDVLEWMRSNGWFYNQQYLCYEAEPTRTYYGWQTNRFPTVYAFKYHSDMLLFKLVMCG